ncbi:gamma-glutamylcyclotransferase family protein [Aspergillus lucknowensis]|uniref:Gamma-glutamylcyclotransferase AIG2-like domain-containing protein n=1 Tax=Aspergillus lucknowensis TaxID=176173 RepID=A0ABR4LIT6_9EURO
MRWKEGYPLDFKAALRTPSTAKVRRLLSKPSHAPRFVYGALILPTVLKYFFDLPQNAEVDMVPATLWGFKLYTMSEGGLPTILRSPEESCLVEGMLVFGLDEFQRNRISEVEGGGGMMKFVDVEVQVYQKDLVGHYEVKDLRPIDAGTFVWDRPVDPGMVPVKATYWSPDDFLAGQFYEHITLNQRRELDLDALD